MKALIPVQTQFTIRSIFRASHGITIPISHVTHERGIRVEAGDDSDIFAHEVRSLLLKQQTTRLFSVDYTFAAVILLGWRGCQKEEPISAGDVV